MHSILLLLTLVTAPACDSSALPAAETSDASADATSPPDATDACRACLAAGTTIADCVAAGACH